MNPTKNRDSTFLRLAQLLVLLSWISAAPAQILEDADTLGRFISIQNNQILQAVESRGGVNRQALASNDPLRTVLQQRAQYLRKLIAADPGRALALRLPDDVRQRLLAGSIDLKDTIEEFGRWRGPADVVVEDRFDLRTSRTLVQVQDSSGDLEVFLRERFRISNADSSLASKG